MLKKTYDQAPNSRLTKIIGSIRSGCKRAARMIKLRYGNTNTFLLCGNAANLLIDTDYAGTLPVFYKEIKKYGYVHFSDEIFSREKRLRYVPIDEKPAVVISCSESREFLFSIGINGEIISTPSHSADSVSVILDDGDCIVGDLEPIDFLGAYEDNPRLEKDWSRVMNYKPNPAFRGA